MKSIVEMTLGEFAAYICSYLHEHDIHCVLTGGACVSIYTHNQYRSFDLDFIENSALNRKQVRNILALIGFYEEDRYFKHPATKYFVEFPPGPLAVGREAVRETVTLEFVTGKLVLLSPTDCVKDRLAAFYHWKDMQCLEQAVLVAQSNPVDLDEVARWSESEDKGAEFERIKGRFPVDKPKGERR